MKKLTLVIVLMISGVALAGCASDGPTNSSGGDVPTGTLQQAGSSTVFPIAEAWAEEIAIRTGGQLQVVVQGGGSGAGASKLCAGEIDIGDMSREMEESEKEDCRANGIEPVEWKVAYDGLTVVVNNDNTWVDFLTVDELEHIWRSENPAQKWSDVREGWPDEKIILYGPDSDSGTYDYFNEVILGTDCGPDGRKVCPPRSDYTPSADDNVLVEGVARSKYALGHFGFAYFIENEGRLKGVPIAPEDGGEAVAPSFETIADGSYNPLGRPIYMYTNGLPEPGTPLHAYFEYAMNDGQDIVRDVGYVELDQKVLDEQRERL